jgi:HEAT repeats/PBS lyase HEAT-like repeat
VARPLSESDERVRDIRRAYRSADTAFLRESLRDPENRRAAVRYLAKLGCSEAGPEILRLTRAEDPRVRRAAVRALGKLGHEPALPRLREILETDSDRATREWAIVAVGQLRDRKSYDLLLSLLEASALSTRRAAAIALGELGDPRAISAIREASSSEPIHHREHYRRTVRKLRRAQ